MRDAHRVLVDGRDRLGNVEQIRALAAGGYTGPCQFEPFAEELRTLADPARAIGRAWNSSGQKLAEQGRVRLMKRLSTRRVSGKNNGAAGRR